MSTILEIGNEKKEFWIEPGKIDLMTEDTGDFKILSNRVIIGRTKIVRGVALAAVSLCSLSLLRKSVLLWQSSKSEIMGYEFTIVLLRSAGETVGVPVRKGEMGVSVGLAKRAAGVGASASDAMRVIPDRMKRERDKRKKRGRDRGVKNVQYGILSRESSCSVFGDVLSSSAVGGTCQSR